MIHELRVYNCVSGRLPDLVRRFETITLIYGNVTVFGRSHFGRSWSENPTSS